MGAVGSVLDVDAEALGDALGEGAARGLGIELQGTAHEMAGIEVAQHKVGVGHRRDGAALAIGDGPGLGTGALGADLERAAAIDPDMRAAAGADLGEVDGRHLERVAGSGEKPRADHDARAHLILERAGEAAVLDERRLGGGAAHVEADEVLEPHRRGDGLGADDARCRARSR